MPFKKISHQALGNNGCTRIIEIYTISCVAAFDIDDLMQAIKQKLPPRTFAFRHHVIVDKIYDGYGPNVIKTWQRQLADVFGLEPQQDIMISMYGLQACNTLQIEIDPGLIDAFQTTTSQSLPDAFFPIPKVWMPWSAEEVAKLCWIISGPQPHHQAYQFIEDLLAIAHLVKDNRIA